jgi:hypothetical protein
MDRHKQKIKVVAISFLVCLCLSSLFSASPTDEYILAEVQSINAKLDNLSVISENNNLVHEIYVLQILIMIWFGMDIFRLLSESWKGR